MKRQNFIVSITAAGMLLSMTGCVSKDTKSLLSSYASASTKAQKNVMATYEDALDSNKRARLVQAVRDGATVNDLKPIDIDYSGQKRSLTDLISFSEALVSLTSDDINAKIDENSAKLYNSAKKLSENEAIQYDATNDLKLFTTLINGSFRGYIEYRRFENAKELVILADKWVQPVIDSLDKDIDKWKSITKRSLQDQKNITLMILNYPGTYCQVKDSTKTCVPLAETFDSKLELYAEVARLQQRIDNIDKEFVSLSKSIKSLSTLHKKVIESIKNNEINYESLSEDFLALKEHTESLKKFKLGLED